jgi:hypothetical protein
MMTIPRQKHGILLVHYARQVETLRRKGVIQKFVQVLLVRIARGTASTATGDVA